MYSYVAANPSYYPIIVAGTHFRTFFTDDRDTGVQWGLMGQCHTRLRSQPFKRGITRPLYSQRIQRMQPCKHARRQGREAVVVEYSFRATRERISDGGVRQTQGSWGYTYINRQRDKTRTIGYKNESEVSPCLTALVLESQQCMIAHGQGCKAVIEHVPVVEV